MWSYEVDKSLPKSRDGNKVRRSWENPRLPWQMNLVFLPSSIRLPEDRKSVWFHFLLQVHIASWLKSFLWVDFKKLGKHWKCTLHFYWPSWYYYRLGSWMHWMPFLKGPNGPRKMDHCFWLKFHFNGILRKTICILISFMKWQHFQPTKKNSKTDGSVWVSTQSM